jgi:hypothetical protein
MTSCESFLAIFLLCSIQSCPGQRWRSEIRQCSFLIEVINCQSKVDT